jgi:uncharacterized protein
MKSDNAESIRNKLRSLGVTKGTSSLPARKPRKSGFPIDAVVSGEDVETIEGSTYVVRTLYPYDQLHGKVNIGQQVGLTTLARWGKLEYQNLAKTNLVFLDTETSGLSGGVGTFVFMVGLGYFCEEGLQVIQLFMRNPGDEAGLLAYLDQVLTPFEVLVTFNGKSFDIPVLNHRYTLHRLSSSVAGRPHLDLLHIARRLWKERLPSRTLGALEQEIIGFSRGQDEVPGWMVPELYVEYLQSGDSRPLAGVFYHNEMDIVSLGALLVCVAELLERPLHEATPHGLDMAAIGRIYEDLDEIQKAVAYYERSIDMGMPRNEFIRTVMRYALIHKKRAEWDQACLLWEKAAELDHIEACVELAKFFEHQACNLVLARHWTQNGLALAETTIRSKYSRQQVETLLLHRLSRVERKIGSAEELSED